MNTELKKFVDSVKSHEDMYKSAEVIIWVLEGYVIGLYATLSNKERREESELIVNLDIIKVIKEYWSIEELFKKLHSNEIMLPSDKNPLPFIWNEIENEDKLSLSNVTRKGYRCLHYSGYSSNLRTNYGKLSWNEAEREIEEKYGVKTLWDLFKSKFPRLSNIGVQGPTQSGSPGFHIIAPIYTKMRRCGIEEKKKERKLKAFVESTNAKGVNIKINNPEEHSTVSLEVIPDGKLIEDTETTKVYEIQWNIPKNCQKLKIELIDKLLPLRKS